MKKTFVFILLLLPIFAFSQEPYAYKRGGKVYENNVRLTPNEIEFYFSSNKEIMHLYNSGMQKKIGGNFLIYGGLVTLVVGTNQVDREVNSAPIFLGIGTVCTLIGIPVKIGYNKRIKKAVKLMNAEIKNQKTSFDFQSAAFIANSNGIGISINF